MHLRGIYVCAVRLRVSDKPALELRGIIIPWLRSVAANEWHFIQYLQQMLHLVWFLNLTSQ